MQGLQSFSDSSSFRCSSRSTRGCWRLCPEGLEGVTSSHKSCLKGRGQPKPSSIIPTEIQVCPGWDPAHSEAADHESCPRCPSCTLFR